VSDPGQRSAGRRRQSQLRAEFFRLREPPIEHPITAVLDPDKWVESNLLIDQGLEDDEVARRVGVDTQVVSLIRSPRRCLELHDGDIEALARCLDGK
jgi:hypothetical protein